MSRTEELEAALRAEWSDEALSVYADHLQAAGDPRGELIALDLEGADGEGAIARRGELLGIWLGDHSITTWWDAAERRWYAGNRAQGTWILAELGLLEIVHEGEDTESPTALLQFLATPASRYVHRISIAASTRALRDVFRVLTSRDRPWVRALALARQDGARDIVLRDTTSLGATLPNLTHLAVTGSRVIDELDHAGVIELVVTGESAIRLTAGAPLSSVTTLDFAFTPGTTHSDLTAYLRRDRLPNVKRLILSRQEPNLPIHLARLPELELADQLTYLELPSLRSAADARLVELAADRMRSLRELVIARAYMCHGDNRVELARARVRAPLPFPWRPLDELVAERLHLGAENAPASESASVVSLILALEPMYEALPPDLRATWFKIWTSLETARRSTVETRLLSAALEPLALDDAWQRVHRRLQWESSRVSLSFDGLG